MVGTLLPSAREAAVKDPANGPETRAKPREYAARLPVQLPLDQLIPNPTGISPPHRVVLVVAGPEASNGSVFERSGLSAWLQERGFRIAPSSIQRYGNAFERKLP